MRHYWCKLFFARQEACSKFNSTRCAPCTCYIRQYTLQADIYFTGFVDDEYYDELVANIKKLFHAQRMYALFDLRGIMAKHMS